MIKIKSFILDETKWLEVTWVDEISTQVPVEEGEEDKVETAQVHCESYSGHPEHILMLRAKSLEFETSLEEYEDLIAECESKFVAPSEEEIQAEITANLVQEAKNYLASTDYKMTVDYFGSLSKEIQDELALKRAEAREYVRNNLGAK